MASKDDKVNVWLEEDMDKFDALDKKLDKVLDAQSAQKEQLAMTNVKLDQYMAGTAGDHDKLTKLDNAFRIHIDEYNRRKQNTFTIWLAILGLCLGLVAEGVILIVKLM